MSIHPTAVVDAGAEIDPAADIGPYAVIGPHVRIGADTWVGPHAVVTGRTTVGRENRIFQFASVGEVPQDKKYAGEESELVIGDGNTIREFVTLNCGTAQGHNRTQVGNHNWIMAYVHIAHDCVIGDDTTFANGATLAGHVEVQDHAILGGFTLVHQFCRVGRYAFSGMGTALNKDLPPFVLASGNLARPYGLNREGLRRAGFSEETMEALARAYKLMIRVSGGQPEEEVSQLVGQYPEVEQMRAFIAESRRGIIREKHSD